MTTQENSTEKPKKSIVKKLIRNTLIFIVLGSALAVYVCFYYPFGEGVKAGQLNYVVYKGYVFKTYEGKMIQAGFRGSAKTPGTAVQSYEFEFSISNKDIAEKLMKAGGKEVQLHYKEYLGAIPWRGYSKYVVDDILEIKDTY